MLVPLGAAGFNQNRLHPANQFWLVAGQVVLFEGIGFQIVKLKRLAPFLIGLPLASANSPGEALWAFVKLPVEIVVLRLVRITPQGRQERNAVDVRWRRLAGQFGHRRQHVPEGTKMIAG